MPSTPFPAFTQRGMLLVVTISVLSCLSAGCQNTSADSAAGASAKSAKSADAATVLKEMAAAYRDATSYEDAGELHLSAAHAGEEKQETQPLPFSVAYQRPNKIRAQSLQASVVADGTKFHAFIDSLEGQMLSLPGPEKITIENLVPDPMLAEAMHGQIDVSLPQASLLLDANALTAIAGDGTPTLLEDAKLGDVICQRVAVKGPRGTSVFWISPDDHLLRKFEFPSDAMKEKFSLTSCSLWAEFNGARTNTKIAPGAFELKIPEGTRLLKRFLPPPPDAPPAILAQAPGEFTFVNLKGEAVNREALKDKIVVLDMWATWCGWCFEGFPNLEKVYQQYKDNDKIVILAVSRDEPTVSDEDLRQAFIKAKLSIPIVRDQEQITGKIFQVEGLPTMVILGADGTVQDFHVGYDPQLAETLPKKLDRLLAGESLAKDELEKYEQARKEYDQQMNDALAESDDSGSADKAVAEK